MVKVRKTASQYVYAELVRYARGVLLMLAASITLVQAATERAPVEFNIPSQSLAAALNSLALQADCQMLFEDSIVTNLMAPEVVGRMSPGAALHILLAATALEYIEDDTGTIVVRRKAPAPVVVRRPARRVAPIAEPVAAPVVLPITVEAVEEGPWIVALRASHFHPDNESAAFSSAGPPRTVVRADQILTTDQLLADLGIEYFFDQSWSGELSVTLPRVFDLTLRNDAAPTGSAQVGTFRHMSGVLTLKYNFLPDHEWRPYLGAGINVTTLYHVSANPYGLEKTSIGPAVQAGVDMQLAKNWFLNADIKWAEVRSDVRFRGKGVSTLQIDPVSIGFGIRHRFGATTAPSVSSPVLQSTPAG